MYLLTLIPLYIVTYLIWIAWIQIFFGQKIKIKENIVDILIIVLTYISSLFIVTLISDSELANRVQHALGWWFLVTLLWYLSYLRSNIHLSRFQLFHLLFFVALTLGIANELAESVLQNNFWILFAPNIEDTWYDLWANTIWALLWAGVFSYLGFSKGK